jgi:hypothetical protein
MSTVKISELPVITQINANTANTIFVGLDIPTNITGKMTLTTLARGLYSNNNLIVGNTEFLLPNAVAQYTGTSDLYVQTSLQNLAANGSGDIVVTADNGTDTAYFIDLGITGSTYNYPGYTVMKSDDGYLLVVGDTESDPGGNLVIGTVTEGKDITFFQGGAEEANAIAQFKYNTGLKLLKKPLTFADGTTQNTAVLYSGVDSRIAANVVTINSYISANADSANSVINSRITSNIATANIFTQAAYNKANNALANTSGTFGGNLNIAGNLTVLGVGTTGLFTVNASSYSANTPSFTVSGALGGASYTPSNQGYMTQVTGYQDTPTRMVIDSFGTNAYALIAGRTARGTVASPTATANGDVLMRLSGNGFANTFSQFGVGRIDFVATENYTDSAKGSEIQFWNTIPGTNTLNKIVTMNATHTEVSGYIKPQKGFIWYPRTYPAAQTAVSLSFVSDAVIKVDIANDMTVSFADHLSGKVVDMWITNTSGSSRTVTHGCTALFSTTNSTTVTVPSTSTIMLKYICFDETSANVHVAAIYG